jgi:hypothetical protein
MDESIIVSYRTRIHKHIFTNRPSEAAQRRAACNKTDRSPPCRATKSGSVEGAKAESRKRNAGNRELTPREMRNKRGFAKCPQFDSERASQLVVFESFPRDLSNLGTWELGNLGTWELGNFKFTQTSGSRETKSPLCFANLSSI